MAQLKVSGFLSDYSPYDLHILCSHTKNPRTVSCAQYSYQSHLLQIYSIHQADSFNLQARREQHAACDLHCIPTPHLCQLPIQDIPDRQLWVCQCGPHLPPAPSQEAGKLVTQTSLSHPLTLLYHHALDIISSEHVLSVSSRNKDTTCPSIQNHTFGTYTLYIVCLLNG